MPKWLKKGRVIKCWIDDLRDSRLTDGKWKYCVLVGFDPDRDHVLFVLINSQFPTFFASNRPDFELAQMVIRHSDYSHFLEHDSWIDCYQIAKKSYSDLVNEFSDLSPPTKDHGGIRPDDLCKILRRLNDYGELPMRERRMLQAPIMDPEGE